MDIERLNATVRELVQPGKGLLAADESIPTITRRFAALGIPSTPETRRGYRELLLGAEGIGDYLSGVILFEETLEQKASDGTPLPELARRQGVVPGIKVDKGLAPLALSPGDKVTQGLDGLAERLEGYKGHGARFAKWRAVYQIGPRQPSWQTMESNAEVLARYAAICQSLDVVPIVEPEVLIDGDHAIEQCAEVSELVLNELYYALRRHHVVLEATLLKPNMVLPGKAHPRHASPDEVALRTVEVLERCVPAAVPGVNFLSGGQTPEEATENLNAMNRHFRGAPWSLSFSFARALQDPVMATWRGNPDNVEAARHQFIRRARLNSAAQRGEYSSAMEASQ